MIILSLIIGAVLLIAAVYFHALAQANVITPIDRVWYERLFTGNRASKDNLNEAGLRNRRLSNQCAAGGFLMIGIYVTLASIA
jgi:hypothetical protein